MDLKEVRIWNVKYNLLTVSEVVDIVEQWIGEGRKGIHLTGSNHETIVNAQTDELLREAIMSSDIVNIDSYLPARIFHKMGYDIKERASTPDILDGFFEKANEKHQKVFLFGATDSTLEKLCTVLRRDYPGMVIAGTRNGYYTDEEEPQIAEMISKLAPDFLFVAMPSPRKERFILKYKKQMNVGVLYGVGGAFDAKAGVLPRPPKWLRGHGGEAFFRMIRNPKVYGKRWPYYVEFYKLVNSWKKNHTDN